MDLFLIFPYYLSWHYSTGISDFIRLSKNFIVFTYNFFSLKTLLGSLFSPWRRIKDNYSKDESVFATVIFNTIMRLVGAVVRSIFLVVGSVATVALVFISMALFVFWLSLPFIIFSLVGFEVRQFLKM